MFVESRSCGQIQLYFWEQIWQLLNYLLYTVVIQDSWLGLVVKQST